MKVASQVVLPITNNERCMRDLDGMDAQAPIKRGDDHDKG